MTAPDPDQIWDLEVAKARQAAKPGAPSHPGGFWSAAAVGLLGWAYTMLFSPFTRPLPDAPLFAGLHREITNRTRHLIDAVVQEAPDAPVLLLGRPPHSPVGRTKALRAAGVRGRLIQPFDWLSALAALPAIVRRLREGPAATTEWRPEPPELAAICFRMALGETGAAWARRHVPPGQRTVVFGHTGVADSHLLERALQGRGARTVHWVHGVSLGLNFVAGSTLGVFQCGSDARWHERLGGYRTTVSLPAKAPERGAAGAGWLVLSNLIHPMNADYRRDGIAGEVALLEAVAEAAGEARKVWKPHPVLAGEPAEVQEAIADRASALGFETWPEGRDLAFAPDFAVVVCTPSTVVLDVLRLGVLPILFGEPEDGSASAQMPLRADSAESLVAAAARLPQADFDAVWARIAPARKPTLAELLALTRD